MTENVSLDNVVEKSARGPALGIWSEAIIRVDFDCSDEFDGFTHSVSVLDGQYTVNVAAMVRKNAEPKRRCLLRPFQLINVPLSGGFVSKDKVRVQPMLSQSIELGKTFPGQFVDGSRIKIKSVTRLCPDGATCLVDGTIVTFQVEKSCLEYIGPVGYNFNQANNQIALAVGSFLDVIAPVAPVAPVALCSQEVKVEEFSLQLIDFYVDSVRQIDLDVLGSKSQN
jgi:hypothetical protein